jgi:uncharacterized protein
MLAKTAELEAILLAHAPLLVAYSGGVDSAFLLAFAHRTLGPGASAAIADSPSLPRQALADALALAAHIGADVEVLPTRELENPSYAANPVDRCYFCKAELFRAMEDLAARRGFRALAYGENADDMRQERPGRRAAEEFSVLAPLRDARLTKAEIRALSRELGLPTADAPAQPCLSSRIPHGTPVTLDALHRIERAEAFVRSLGFQVFRVRHIALPGGRRRARLQVAPEEQAALEPINAAVLQGLSAAGFDEVEIDPRGYLAPPPIP